MARTPKNLFELDERWAVGTDPYNWILYRKEKKRHKAVGFYGTPESLLRGLWRKCQLEEFDGEDLPKSLESSLSHALALSEAFWGHLDAQTLSKEKTPWRRQGTA